MSVLMIDVDVYTHVYRKLIQYQFNSQCDINYCETFRRLSEKQIEKLVRTWCDLNEESYNCKYEEPDNKMKLSEFIDFEFNNSKTSTYQLLKWLECINYNIETYTIDRLLTEYELKAIDTLHKGIEEIKSVIIKEIPAYKEAKWSSL